MTASTLLNASIHWRSERPSFGPTPCTSETTEPAATSASIMTVHCTPSSESYSAVHTFTTPCRSHTALMTPGSTTRAPSSALPCELRRAECESRRSRRDSRAALFAAIFHLLAALPPLASPFATSLLSPTLSSTACAMLSTLSTLSLMLHTPRSSVPSLSRIVRRRFCASETARAGVWTAKLYSAAPVASAYSTTSLSVATASSVSNALTAMPLMSPVCAHANLGVASGAVSTRRHHSSAPPKQPMPSSPPRDESAIAVTCFANLRATTHSPV